MIVDNLWLKYVVTLDVCKLSVSVRRIHVVLNTPSWTIVEYFCSLRSWVVWQCVWQVILKTSDSLRLFKIVFQCFTSLTSQTCLYLLVCTCQVIVNDSLDTIQVQVWHEYQTTEVTRQ